MADDYNERRFRRIFDRFEQIESVDNLAALWKEMKSLYELTNIAYLGTGIPRLTDKEPYLSVTYSEDWVQHYKDRNYVEVDPVLTEGFKTILPMEWSRFSVSTPVLKQFFGEANEFGIGRHGLTIPIRGRIGERALFSITSDVSLVEWRRMRRHFMRDFQLFGFFAHELILRVEHVMEYQVSLAPQEIRCLHWVALGKTAEETAIILGLSGRTVRFYLENARRKLQVINNTQAVAKAIRLNII